jgi:hypothetical protein
MKWRGSDLGCHGAASGTLCIIRQLPPQPTVTRDLERASAGKYVLGLRGRVRRASPECRFVTCICGTSDKWGVLSYEVLL